MRSLATLAMFIPSVVAAAPTLEVYDSAPWESGKEVLIVLKVSNPDDQDYFVMSPTITEIPFDAAYEIGGSDMRIRAAESEPPRRCRLRARSYALIDANIVQTVLRTTPVRFRVQLYADALCREPVLTNELIVRPEDLGHSQPEIASESNIITGASARSELEAMLETDQSLRRELTKLEQKYGRDSAEVKEAWAKQSTIDAHNLRRLEEIIAQYGWPGRSQFGSKAATTAFLILQHSDLSAQKKYLPLARAAAAKGEMQSSSLALLEDRVRLKEGQKQIYGSQVTRNSAGEWEPSPIEDEAQVDTLRASVGLGPLAAYLQGFADRSGGRVNPRWARTPERKPDDASGAVTAGQ